MAYQDINAETIDRWIREGWEWGKPISHEIYEKAKNGEWDVFLTPTKPVPLWKKNGFEVISEAVFS